MLERGIFGKPQSQSPQHSIAGAVEDQASESLGDQTSLARNY